VTQTTDDVSPPTSGVLFGYTRVSTVAQTLHQQHDAFKAAGASKIYSDTMSGARDDRPGLVAL
jgi:DNA invertase Pin-like site-specific DNA recombinase